MLKRLQCLLFGHVPEALYWITDRVSGQDVNLWLCESCKVYYNDREE